MAIIATVNAKEGFLVQMNGDYNVPFDEVVVTGTFQSGQVLSDASTAVGSTTTDVLGIVASDVDGTAWVRVLTRGNPTTVNAQELIIGDAVAADVYAALEAKGIVVVNR